MKKLLTISLLVVVVSGCSAEPESTEIVEAKVLAKYQTDWSYPYRIKLSYQVNEIEEKFALSVSGEFYEEVVEGDKVIVKRFIYKDGVSDFTWSDDSKYSDSLKEVKVQK